MSSKMLMNVSAVIYGVCGLALLFAPEEILARVAPDLPAVFALVLQLLGAALFALGMMNRTARTSLLGGIYGRGIVVGNFAFAFISALLILRALLHVPATPWLWCAAVVSVGLAIAFGALFFGKATQE